MERGPVSVFGEASSGLLKRCSSDYRALAGRLLECRLLWLKMEARVLPIPFTDRVEAGRLLGAELVSRRVGANPIVLALPRGGVVIAAAAADALNAPLDIVVVRKLGVPWEPELAMGAIAGGTRVLDREVIRQLGISAAEVHRVILRETLEMARREAAYREGRPALELRDKTVILVDDGVATGATMAAAARQVRSLEPRKVVVAAPVASSQAAERIAPEADECVWLALPEPFLAVGQWYDDFREITETEVRSLLKDGYRYCSQ
jgi:putative phosphoribosyl transferase